LIASQEETLSERTKSTFRKISRDFEKWRGDKPISEDLVSEYVRCFMKGSKLDASGTVECEVVKHKASSTKTMFSHLRKYLEKNLHFVFSEKGLDNIYSYLDTKRKKEPVKQATVFSMDDLTKLFQIEPTTLPQIRDKLLFVFGVCALARKSELALLQVDDVSFEKDGLMVTISRKKTDATREIQRTWVNGTFYGWDVVENLKRYLSFIPETGALWRNVAPCQRERMNVNACGDSVFDSVCSKMATLLKLPNPEKYHSHSMRRTGASLLAMNGGSEQQIKSMGNWKSSTVANRYIDTSALSMQKSGKVISMPEAVFPRAEKAIPKPVPIRVSVPVSIPAPVGDPQLMPDSSDKLVQDAYFPRDETSVLAPHPKRMRTGGIFITGTVQKLVIIHGKSDDIDTQIE